MSQTLQNGVVVPINADAYNLTADLATMGSKSNVIITVANQAARDALTAYAGMCVCRLDLPTAPIERFDGTIWQGAAMNSYTPNLTASTNPSLGSGSQLGTYILLGKLMIGQFFVSFGAGSTVGSGTYAISLPTGFTYGGLGSAVPIGTHQSHVTAAVDVSGYMKLVSAGASSFNLYWQSSTTAASPLTSVTGSWTSGSYLAGNFQVPIV